MMLKLSVLLTADLMFVSIRRLKPTVPSPSLQLHFLSKYLLYCPLGLLKVPPPFIGCKLLYFSNNANYQAPNRVCLSA